MHRLTDTALALALAGAGTSLIGLSATIAAASARQAVRAAPFPLHPWVAAAGLLAFPLGLACLCAARRRLDEIAAARFRAWELRQA
jgi:hypothetical protein